jgi:putative ABC transport system ATP-binding protein
MSPDTVMNLSMGTMGTGTEAAVIRAAGLELRPAGDDSVRVCPGDWQVRAGERWALKGPSGCGKTTLVNALCGLLAPTAGSLRVMGRDLYAMGSGERDRFRGTRMGVVHQEFHLLPGFTAMENLAVALRFAAGQRGRSARDRALEMLTAAGLADRAETRVERLSRGEAQRVAVARALVHQPDLLLTDEPTASLDPGRAVSMLAWIDALRDQTGCAWICVTHDPAVASRFEHCLDAMSWRSPEPVS